MKDKASDLSLNLNFLMLKQFGRRNIQAFAAMVGIDAKEMGRLLNQRKPPSPSQIIRIERAFDLQENEMLWMPHAEFVTSINMGISNRIKLAVPECIRLSWAVTANNFLFIKGSYILYYYSRRYETLIGAELKVTHFDAEGIYVSYDIPHPVEPRGSKVTRFDARILCAGNLMYFYSAPVDGSSTLGFGIFTFHNANRREPFTGELLLVQSLDTRDGPRDAAVPTKGMLYPLPIFRERDTFDRDKWVRDRTGPLKQTALDKKVAAYFFAAP